MELKLYITHGPLIPVLCICIRDIQPHEHESMHCTEKNLENIKKNTQMVTIQAVQKHELLIRFMQ